MERERLDDQEAFTHLRRAAHRGRRPEPEVPVRERSNGIGFFDDWVPELKAAYNLRLIGE